MVGQKAAQARFTILVTRTGVTMNGTLINIIRALQDHYTSAIYREELDGQQFDNAMCNIGDLRPDTLAEQLKYITRPKFDETQGDE